MFDLQQDAVLQGNVQSAGQVLVELLKEHLIPFFILPIVLRIFLLNAVIGQMAGFVLEIINMIRLGGSPQHALSVEVDIVLVIHQDPASASRQEQSLEFSKVPSHQASI